MLFFVHSWNLFQDAVGKEGRKLFVPFSQHFHPLISRYNFFPISNGKEISHGLFLCFLDEIIKLTQRIFLISLKFRIASSFLLLSIHILFLF